MEEKQISMPKPPKALRQNKTEKVEKVESIAKEPNTQETKKQEELVQNKTSETKKAPKKKINFEPLSNWAGFLVSLAILGVFIFLLIVN